MSDKQSLQKSQPETVTKIERTHVAQMSQACQQIAKHVFFSR